jgi:glucokinase
LPTSAHTEPRLQLMTANVLTPEDVLVVISSTGRIPELNIAVEAALARGVQVVAITASQSPLAKRATITIAVDHSEDVATQVPMVSRVLYLLLIDILAVGVAMRTSKQQEALAALPDTEETQDAAVSNRLARMVPHSSG